MRLIDADELEERIGGDDLFADFVLLLRDAPTVDAVEVVHGHWIPIPEHENKRCSVCRIVFSDFMLGYYCPHCGAKMDGGATNAQT